VAKPKPPLAAAALAATDAEWKAVEAALGAHSATNFYKGLAGGDVVASGGLFVATYQVPPVGERLLLRVSMPGGYEFEARGVVAWTRDVALSSTASGATPGFGAQFSEISDEGRGLIQRYVRNREPLFHDDL
jgi:Tfp pilus assembly protein PilZ